jgi:hypothetical protein
MPRSISGPKSEEITTEAKNCILWSFIIYTLHKMLVSQSRTMRWRECKHADQVKNFYKI